MAGKECVALAVDKRFGSGPALVNVQPRHVLMASPRTLVAFTGLEGDVQSLGEELSAQVASRYTRGLGFDTGGGGGPKSNAISPRAMNSLTSHTLYARRRAPYYVEPVVVGLEEACDDDGREEDQLSDDAASTVKRYRPFLCTQDLIGAKSHSAAFCCAGAATKSLYGTAEATWKPDLTADELLKVCGQAFLSALERDCLSGYGAVVYIITQDGIVEYDLASRND
jgi:20S proteasome subunit beta 3